MGREGDGKLSRTLIRMVNSKVALCVDGCSVAAFGDVARMVSLQPISIARPIVQTPF
jgi:hypothetical protein